MPCVILVGLSIDPANPAHSTDPKGLGRVEWMLGLGSGPIFGSSLGSGRFQVQPDLTDLKKELKKKTTTTNVSDNRNYG